ncbi:MAG: ABC transporter ATP-binding protein [Microbacterium sp.]|uniref:ABC transporter ATP-binding protein n=1 Tax=Microbacterium ginsengisoli TaxID=400772 RepID=A0A0F0LR15_9MICO|nr:ABC transporter ATP-binding protein [Microbacterium ginsengisoli]KJL35667.1 Oligopeptide transport ATP-binding protein OppD [Microbacterium ginsengisoli]MAL07026.1 ABC transporter ATP-binding protein [Microbacterium sp.]HAN24641.1 ABC transporter ATP-binding protein [Microbacterium ginsengisoli]
MSLEVTDLVVEIGGVRVVDGVTFAVPEGARVGLIGASGSGKSLTARALLGLLPDGAAVSGSIRWQGVELVGLRDRELARRRGRELAMVFQDPLTALDPVRTVGRQISEAAAIHGERSRTERRRLAVQGARRVALPDPERIVARYPHQLSGGQRQRVAIAMALAARPRLLVADEPTTALDVTVQAGILELLRRLADEDRMSLVFITHDLAVLAQVATEAVVLSAGRVVETGPLTTLLTEPASPVTRGLLRDAAATLWRGAATSDLPEESA